jgi:predicted dehydrogenase
MVDAAKKHNAIVQVGFQRRQSDAIKEAADYIRGGKAGRILQAEAHIHYDPNLAEAFARNTSAKSLDWDAWCGPAPKLPLTEKQGHFIWRFEQAYGNGHMVDWGIHWHDAIRFILGEGMPRSIQASGGTYYLADQMNTPDFLTVHYEFERCPVVWRHRLWGVQEFNPETNIGMFFYGDKETIFLNDERMVVIPKGGGERRVVEAKNDTSAAHMADFLAAVRSKKQPSVTVEDGYRSTATVQLGMVSYLTRSRVDWDARAEKVVGNEAAAKLLKREYREPYEHPYRA